MIRALIKSMFYTTALLLAAFVTLGLLGAWDAPAKPGRADRQSACSRAWHDAAPGPEKRTARAMCDALGVQP